MKVFFKRFAAILMTVLLVFAALPVSAEVQYSDPVMPGIDLTSIVDPTTPLRTYVFMQDDKEIGRQTVKNGETLVEPEVVTGDHERFVGWEPAVTFGTVSGIDKTETVTVNAKIEKVYYVFFTDKDGRVLATKEGKSGETIGDFDEITELAENVIFTGSDESIVGWQDENENQVTSVTLADKDVTLTVRIEQGYWVVFDSKGGSYVAPHFYTADQTAAAPDAPTKAGYTFGGWYTDEAFSKPANFANIRENTTVYAKWVPASANYTVIHWVENADNDEYSYKESEHLSGTVDGQTAATAKSYDGFTAQTIEQETISGDGSTIVNVYYKRNVYEVKFYYKNRRVWNEYSSYRITAKYGQNIKDKWPGGVWYVDTNQRAAQAHLEVMPLGGTSFYGKVDENYGNPAYYYVEVLPGESGTETKDGKNYKVDHTDDEPRGWTVTQEDKYDITGFTYSTGTANGRSINGAKFYYTRNSYNVVYYSGDSVDNTVSYKYEQDISNAGSYTPTGKEGYIFDGWYADPECTVKYNFDGKTMPAENIIVYAKWVMPVYTVTVYDADKVKILGTFTDVPQGSTIDERDMPYATVPEGFKFIDWMDMETDQPFNFEGTQIHKDYSIYAKIASTDTFTVVYDANGGASAPTDATKYAAGSAAVILPKGDMTAPDDPEKSYFLGWAKTKDAAQPDYQGGETLDVSEELADENHVITLYAVWGPKPVTTTLTYNANFEGADPATASHVENGSSTLPNNASVALYTQGQAGFARKNYNFLGWDTDPNATVPTYKAGDTVIIDNIDQNVLYAIWEKATIDLTVTKQVTGIEDSTTEFTFAVGYTSEAESLDFGNFTLKNGESKTLTVPIGATLNVVESGAAVYNTSAAYGGTTYTATEGENGTRTISGIVINENSTELIVTNAIKTGTLTIAKNVTGLMGDKTKNFEFEYRYGDVSETFTLSDGQSKVLENLPYGTTVTVTETDYSVGGYKTSFIVGETKTEGNTATVTIAQDAESVTFTNDNNANPDTGVRTDILPYAVIMMLTMVGAILLIVRRKTAR